jgi:hypothetical protein
MPRTQGGVIRFQWVRATFTTRAGWLLVAAAVFTAASPVCAGFATVGGTRLRVLLVLATAACSALAFASVQKRQAVLAEIARKLENERADRARSQEGELREEIARLQKAIDGRRIEERRKLGSYLANMAKEVADLFDVSDRTERATRFASIARGVCETTRAMSTTDQARCTWYRLGQNDELIPYESAGGNKPRRSFEPGKKDYRAIQKAVKASVEGCGDRSECHQFYPDLTVDQPPEFRSKSSPRYSTYAGVPVLAGKTWVGWLSLDSQNAGDLDETVDVPLMRVLASMLAIAYVYAHQPDRAGVKGGSGGLH